jgi:hypothetical protein
MISIIKGIKQHICSICRTEIERGGYKVKDSQDNSNRKYYHLKCTPITIINRNLQLWKTALQESQNQ